MSSQQTLLEQTGDLAWCNNSGQASLSGQLLDKLEALDQTFLDWAKDIGAVKYAFPSFVSTRELNKIGYLQSFPHLATFAARIDETTSNLEQFSKDPVLSNGSLKSTELEPISEILTPAACYHFYINFQQRCVSQALCLTTRCVCFRREHSYKPLQRQSNFNMREIVCIGTADEVHQFLLAFRSRLEVFFEENKLPVRFESATDPFFQPMQNAKYLMQKLDPVKTEMVFDGNLAIGSLNLHHNYFGTVFGITRDGQPLHSACVAFGLERWLFMLLQCDTKGAFA